jgi:uncharacterized repeat protein (TIGR02543 family)
MTKKHRSFFIGLPIVLAALWSCNGMATLFHGPKPEEKLPEFTITFNANGATGTAPSPRKVAGGTAISMPAEGELIMSNTVFTGWNISRTGAGTSYPPESPYTVTEDQTFYAQWTDPAGIYTVTYSANGASGAPPSPQKVKQGGSISVAGKGSLANGNKTFDGWNTQADGQGAGYLAEATLVVTADTTLYAQWANDLSAPTGLNVTGQTSNSITLSWQQVSGATGYKVYKGSSSNAVNEFVADTAAAPYTVTGLEPNTGYYFALRGVSASGESPLSAAVQGTTSAATLQAPGNLQVSGQTSNSITLSWQQVSGATGYRISRSTGSANSYSQAGTATSTSYTDTGLTASTTYHYRVTAYNGQGESSPAETSGTTNSSGGTIPFPPAKPTGLVVTNSSSSSVSLSWNSVTDADSYDVYRANTRTANLERRGTNITGTSWTDSSVSGGALYYYIVRGVNTSGASPDSNMAFACAAVHYELQSLSSSVMATLYPGSKHYYRLAVNAGQRITITWHNGSNQDPSSDLRVAAWQNNGIEIFSNGYNGYTAPREVAVTETGFITVEVNNAYGSTSRNYQIYYSY